jgi:hypothetical protein
MDGHLKEDSTVSPKQNAQQACELQALINHHKAGDDADGDRGSLQERRQPWRGEVAHTEQDGEDAKGEGEDALAFSYLVDDVGGSPGDGGVPGKAGARTISRPPGADRVPPGTLWFHTRPPVGGDGGAVGCRVGGSGDDMSEVLSLGAVEPVLLDSCHDPSRRAGRKHSSSLLDGEARSPGGRRASPACVGIKWDPKPLPSWSSARGAGAEGMATCSFSAPS